MLWILLASHPVLSQISISVDSFYASRGDTILLPVCVGDVTDSNIESMQFDFFFSDSILFPIDGTLKGTIAEDWGNLFLNKNNSGELRCGAFGVDYLSGSGVLVFFRFLVVGDWGDSTALEIRNFVFNNGSPAIAVNNGRLIVEKKVNLMIHSNIPNLLVQVDGKSHRLPFSIEVSPFSIHPISFDSVLIESAGARYVFRSRSDGKSFGLPVEVDSTDLDLGLIYQKQFFLNINSSYNHTEGEGWYDADSMAHFNAAKYDSASNSIRYYFLYWSGDTLLTNESGTIKMNTPKTLTANYVEEDYIAISYNIENAGGTIPSVPGVWVEKGEELEVTAFPEGGYYFLGWGGDTSSTVNPLVFTVTHPFNLIAKFGNIFPVELSAWSVKAFPGRVVKLVWRTKSETDNYGFYVQRKDSTSCFKDIAFIKGHGNSTASHTYLFTDKNLDKGNYSYRLKQIDYSGKCSFSSLKTVQVLPIGENFFVENYPNPFNPSTTINYQLSEGANVKIFVFDLLGRRIRTLVDKVEEAGNHSVRWDGYDENSMQVPAGVYIVKMKANQFNAIRKMILIK